MARWRGAPGLRRARPAGHPGPGGGRGGPRRPSALRPARGRHGRAGARPRAPADRVGRSGRAHRLGPHDPDPQAAARRPAHVRVHRRRPHCRRLVAERACHGRDGARAVCGARGVAALAPDNGRFRRRPCRVRLLRAAHARLALPERRTRWLPRRGDVDGRGHRGPPAAGERWPARSGREAAVRWGAALAPAGVGALVPLLGLAAVALARPDGAARYAAAHTTFVFVAAVIAAAAAVTAGAFAAGCGASQPAARRRAPRAAPRRRRSRRGRG